MNKGAIPVLTLALVAASAISLSAHGRGFKGHEGARASDRARVPLTETLSLPDDQQASLAQLKESFGEARQALRKSHRAAFREILTAEQVATLEEIHESGSRRHTRGGRGDALNLTEEQREALEGIRQTTMAEKSALRDEHRAAFEAILTEEQLALLEEFRASRPSHGRHGKTDAPEVGDAVEGEGGISTEAASLTVTAATAVEDQSWGQVKRGFR